MLALIDCPSAYVIDGDTLRCGELRLRLLGIDAPELHGCPRQRVCVAGDSQASTHSLIDGVRMGPIRFQPIKRDRYGRTVALVWVGSVNLSCWQLQHVQAVYIAKWDDGRRVAKACRI